MKKNIKHNAEKSKTIKRPIAEARHFKSHREKSQTIDHDAEKSKPFESHTKKSQTIKSSAEKTEKFRKSSILDSDSFKKTAVSIVFASIVGIIYFLISGSFVESLMSVLATCLIIGAYFFIKIRLDIRARITKMETVFPDFIELMASNLRAGITVDKALLISSRREFAPLDKEILLLGKDLLTGKEITSALLSLANRTKSLKIIKTISVITSGIRSGGDLAVLLEETAVNMRARSFVEKRASSNVLMYVIFIFFAVSVGAPTLFALSSTLVSVLTNILSGLPEVEANINLPIALTSVSIPLAFVNYFSMVFLSAISILASLLLGLVNKGEEREGTRYMLPLIISSLAVYFFVRKILSSYFIGITG